MNYISAAQAAERWGISVKRVQILCKEERIPGVERMGRIWLIPENAKKPADKRIKSGTYIGKFAKYNKKTNGRDEDV